MRAAVLHQYGVPRPGEFEEPQAGPDQAVVEVLAAGLNPVDVAVCVGRFYAGKPPLLSVAGREASGCWMAIACTSIRRSHPSAQWLSER